MENKCSECGIVISLPMYIFVIYLSFLSLSDTINFGVYLLGYDRLPIYLLPFLCVFIGFVLYKIKGHIIIEKLNIDLIGKITICVIFIVAFVRGILPDLSHDTLYGRVFWQFPGFQDNVDYNTFPAGFTFFFPLADRIFYYPRIILGYRLGTMANAAMMCLTFLEARNLIDSLLNNKISVLKKHMESCSNETQAVIGGVFNKSFLAGIACFLYYAIADLGTYMVDLAALPLLLILIRKVVGEVKDISPWQFVSTAYIAGLCFALKMTNIIFLAPIILIYIIKNRKYLRFRYFLLCVLAGMYPCAAYLLYAYLSTGNPVFWTYNAIFKSPYHIDTDFKDMRWGPDNIKDFILWPWRLVVDYGSRVSELSRYPQIYLLMGMISSIYFMVRLCLNKLRDKSVLILVVLFGIFYVLWLYSTGYPRYAIICEIVAAIISMAAICELLLNKRKTVRIIAGFMMVSLIAQTQFNLLEGINNNYDWSWRGTTSDNIINGKFSANVKWLFRDRGCIGSDEQHDKVDLFLESYTSGQYMKIFDENIPIINGRYVETYLAQVYAVKGIDYPSYYKNKVLYALQEGKGVYDILLPEHIQHAFELANAWGLRITECEYLESYYTLDKCPLLIRYELANEENEYSLMNYMYINVAELSDGDNSTLTGLVWLDNMVAPYCTLALNVEWADGGNVEQKITLRSGQLYELSHYFNLPQINKNDKVYLQVVESGIDINIMNFGVYSIY